MFAFIFLDFLEKVYPKHTIYILDINIHPRQCGKSLQNVLARKVNYQSSSIIDKGIC